MKYVIGGSYPHRVIIGAGNDVFHQDLAKALGGRVDGAGHLEIKDGFVRVYGKSIGYDMHAKPEDLDIISRYLRLPAKPFDYNQQT